MRNLQADRSPFDYAQRILPTQANGLLRLLDRIAEAPAVKAALLFDRATIIWNQFAPLAAEELSVVTPTEAEPVPIAKPDSEEGGVPKGTVIPPSPKSATPRTRIAKPRIKLNEPTTHEETCAPVVVAEAPATNPANAEPIDSNSAAIVDPISEPEKMWVDRVPPPSSLDAPALDEQAQCGAKVDAFLQVIETLKKDGIKPGTMVFALRAMGISTNGSAIEETFTTLKDNHSVTPLLSTIAGRQTEFLSQLQSAAQRLNAKRVIRPAIREDFQSTLAAAMGACSEMAFATIAQQFKIHYDRDQDRDRDTVDQAPAMR